MKLKEPAMTSESLQLFISRGTLPTLTSLPGSTTCGLFLIPDRGWGALAATISDGAIKGGRKEE